MPRNSDSTMEEPGTCTTKSPNSAKKARRRAAKDALAEKNVTEFVAPEAPLITGKIKDLAELISGVIWPLLSEIKKELFSSTNKVEQFINKIEELEDKIDDQEEEINVLKLEASRQEKSMEKITKSNSSFSGRLKSMILAQNSMEQRDRDRSIRLINLSYPSPITAWQAALSIYKDLIEPALRLALAAGEISTLPQCASVIEMCHPLPARGERRVLICKFLSRNIKTLFHR